MLLTLLPSTTQSRSSMAPRVIRDKNVVCRAGVMRDSFGIPQGQE